MMDTTDGACLLSPEDQRKLVRLAQLDDTLSFQLEPRARALREAIARLEAGDDGCFEVDLVGRRERLEARLLRLNRVGRRATAVFNRLLSELRGDA